MDQIYKLAVFPMIIPGMMIIIILVINIIIEEFKLKEMSQSQNLLEIIKDAISSGGDGRYAICKC